MSELTIDFFFSFRSPWSYFAVPRLSELQRDYNVRVNLRVVNPIYIRDPSFFEHMRKQWMPYTLTDLMRHSEYLGIPLGMPNPDPVNTELPGDSPNHLVLELNPLGIAAEALGQGVEFAREVSAIIWDGQIDGWNSGDHLEQAAQRAGLTLSAIHQWIDDHPDWAGQLQVNNDALETHHWGVPTMVFNNEPFFGQDRIALLEWRLKKHGLQRRE